MRKNIRQLYCLQGLITIFMICVTLLGSCSLTDDDDGKKQKKSLTSIEVRIKKTRYDRYTDEPSTSSYTKTYYVYKSSFRSASYSYAVPNGEKYSFTLGLNDDLSIGQGMVEWSFSVSEKLQTGKTVSLQENLWQPIWEVFDQIYSRGKAEGTATVKAVTNESITLNFKNVSFGGAVLSLNEHPPYKQLTFNGEVVFKKEKN